MWWSDEVMQSEEQKFTWNGRVKWDNLEMEVRKYEHY